MALFHILGAETKHFSHQFADHAEMNEVIKNLKECFFYNYFKGYPHMATLVRDEATARASQERDDLGAADKKPTSPIPAMMDALE